MQNAYQVLKERGFIEQVSDEERVSELFDRERVTAYIGFDPTASSLHAGSLVPVMGLAHLQRAGHRPLVVVGGGTGLVGDPSGKSEMRQLLEEGAVQSHIEKFRTSFGRLLDLNDEDGLLVDNAEWLCDLNHVEFLRTVGRHFSVNQMLAFEAYKQRMEKGLSFLEFSYQVLQAYDFVELYRRYGCRVQMGGNDQWGNICAGIDLCRRMDGVETYGVTFALLTTADGKKMGKTEAGAVWIDAELFAPYDFYQYWINCDDRDVERFLKIFTYLPLEEIGELCSVEGAALRAVKDRLAHEVTTIVHGCEEADKARAGARSVFGGGGDREHVPSTDLPAEKLAEGISLIDLLALSGLSQSKSDARRLIKAGGAYLNGERVSDIEAMVNADHIVDGEVMLRSGKRKHHRVVVSEG